MNKNIIMILILLTLSSCWLFKEEIIDSKVILTQEEIDKIEKNKLDNIYTEEEKKSQELIKKELKEEEDKINALYELERKKMTQSELDEETRLLNLNKMQVTPLNK